MLPPTSPPLGRTQLNSVDDPHHSLHILPSPVPAEEAWLQWALLDIEGLVLTSKGGWKDLLSLKEHKRLDLIDQ